VVRRAGIAYQPFCLRRYSGMSLMIESANDKSEVETNVRETQYLSFFYLPSALLQLRTPKHNWLKRLSLKTASVVRRMVDVYVQSIVAPDVKLGATITSSFSGVKSKFR
jgi:hypothetical protein